MKRYIKSTEENLTPEQMEEELAQHFAELNKELEEFMSGRIKKLRKFEDGKYTYIERHSIQGMYNDYIKWFNKDVQDYKDGFQSWDTDDTMYILYKNGKTVTISYDSWPEDKKIPVDGIDSIILDGGWGTAVAGPHVELVNYRELVDYGKWGYKDIEQRYYDDDDIRAEFVD